MMWRAWLSQLLTVSFGIRIRNGKAFTTWFWNKQKEVFSVCQVADLCSCWSKDTGCRKVIWIQGETEQVD